MRKKGREEREGGREQEEGRSSYLMVILRDLTRLLPELLLSSS